MEEIPIQTTQPISPVPPANNVLPNQKLKRKTSLPTILVSLSILIITTLVIVTLFNTKQSQTKIAAINDFESCAAAGNPIMESYPEQCAANGKTFTRTLTEDEKKKLNPDPTANWKTYTSTDKMFSFKYPENLTFAYFSKSDGKIYENAPYFFNTQKEADDVVNCVTKQLGTFEKICDRGLFDITDVTSFPENAKQPIQSYKSKNDSSLPSVVEYSDIQGRKWDILGPIYGLGGTQTNAETKINNKNHQVQIHIQDKYIDSIKKSPNRHEIVFIKQVLDTFNFTDLESLKSNLKTFQDPDIKGFSFEYDPNEWSVKAEDARDCLHEPCTSESFGKNYRIEKIGNEKDLFLSLSLTQPKKIENNLEIKEWCFDTNDYKRVGNWIKTYNPFYDSAWRTKQKLWDRYIFWGDYVYYKNGISCIKGIGVNSPLQKPLLVKYKNIPVVVDAWFGNRVSEEMDDAIDDVLKSLKFKEQ